MASTVGLSGCAALLGLPEVDSEDVPKIFSALAEDGASDCAWIGGRGGGGGGVVAPGGAVPVIPTAGGYGSGEILFGRVNSPNTELTIDNGKCIIKRGP